MIAVTTFENIVEWLGHLEDAPFTPHVSINPKEFKSVLGKAKQLFTDGKSAEALQVIDKLIDVSNYEKSNTELQALINNNEWYCLGLAYWLRGIMRMQVEQTVDTYADWQTTLTILRNLIRINQKRLDQDDDYDDEKYPERKQWNSYISWYEARLKDLRVDLACSVEEVFSWLHGLVGQEEKLRPHTRQMWDIIAEKIKNKQWQTVEAYLDEMQDYSEEGTDYLEKPEVLVLCGKALHQAHMSSLAALFLRKAAAEFHPLSHKQAVTRWMLGTVQWWVELEQRPAIENLEQAIEEFEQLQIWAERKDSQNPQDKQSVRLWYEERLEAMRRVLAYRIQQKYP